MMSEINVNDYDSLSLNKSSMENGFGISEDSQAEENEKIQNSQTPRTDSVEISSAARASMQQADAVMASQNSSSAQDTEDPTQSAVSGASQSTAGLTEEAMSSVEPSRNLSPAAAQDTAAASADIETSNI